MHSTTIVYRRRRCGSERLRKNGHANNGAQRAKCLECGRTFDLEPKGPRHDQKFKDQIVSAYQDRMSTRGIKRAFGVCDQTLVVWVGKKAASLPAFEDTPLPGQNGDVLESDNLWSFVRKKTQECWLWIALCRRTRQIVAYTVGDRSQQGALSLRKHVPDDYHHRASRRDFWLAYEKRFLDARTAFAAKRRARPTTPNASLAPCGPGSVGWYAEPISSPSASSATSTLSISSSPATICT